MRLRTVFSWEDMKTQFRYLRRSYRRATGALLLTLPLGGIAFLLPAHAQDAALTTQALPEKKAPKPLPPQQQALIDKLFALAEQEDLCKSLVYLKVENASADDVVAALRKTMPERTLSIEVRGVTPLHTSFDAKSVRVGDVLQQLATQAGGELFVFSRGLILAPTSQLTEEERAEIKDRNGGLWSRNRSVMGDHYFGWSTEFAAREVFAYAIAADIQGGPFSGAIPGVTELKAGDLGPKAQVMLQQLLNWHHEYELADMPNVPATQLIPAVSIRLKLSDPKVIGITVRPDASQPYAPTIVWSFIRPQLP